MVSGSATGYSRLQLIGIVSVLTFGFSSISAIIGLRLFPAVIFAAGFFILVPLIALLGEDFPLVDGDEDSPSPAPRQDPVETLRDRFASGEISQREFEERLEYLLETEDLERLELGSDTPNVREQEAPERRERELERR